MKRMRDFDDILNECIERVIKGEPVEACLKAFPEHAAELEPLLRTAADTHKAASILPRPEFRQRAGYEFQTAIRNLKPKRSGFFRWQLRWAIAVSVVMAVILAGSGTIAASANSMPDQSLYGVKLFTEDVRVALTPSVLGKAELYAEYADTRVNEIIKMADKGEVEQVVKTTERMNNHLIAIAKLTQPVGQADTAAEGVNQPLLGAPTVTVTPTPTTANNHMPVKTPTTAFKTPPVPATASARAVTSNISKADVKTKANAQTELKNTVSSQAVKNTQDLQEALKRAPDSVKQALEKAIKDAQKGYEEALKNSDQNKK
jgi:hypothetical protein